MRTRFSASGCALLGALFLAACSHDLDKLKELSAAANGGAGDGASGNGGGASGTSGNAGSGSAGKGGTSGGSGAGGAGGAAGDGTIANDGGVDTCQPCDDPKPILGGSVKPEACCTGSRGSVCGVKFPNLDRCYVKEIPGTPDTACSDVMKGGVTFPGCCRPDGQCGVAVDSLSLGCVSRQDIPPALGGPLKAIKCVPSCTSDAYCKEFSDALICAEDDDHVADQRTCQTFCQRDKDCAALDGTVCAVQYNKTEDSVDFVCRKPIGTGELGDTCSAAEDCVHGTCAKRADNAMQYCTQLCGGALDCPGTDLMCSTTKFPAPSKNPDNAVTVRICAQK